MPTQCRDNRQIWRPNSKWAGLQIFRRRKGFPSTTSIACEEANTRYAAARDRAGRAQERSTGPGSGSCSVRGEVYAARQSGGRFQAGREARSPAGPDPGGGPAIVALALKGGSSSATLSRADVSDAIALVVSTMPQTRQSKSRFKRGQPGAKFLRGFVWRQVSVVRLGTTRKKTVRIQVTNAYVLLPTQPFWRSSLLKMLLTLNGISTLTNAEQHREKTHR
jgi:hypothetical protein